MTVSVKFLDEKATDDLLHTNRVGLQFGNMNSFTNTVNAVSARVAIADDKL